MENKYREFWLEFDRGRWTATYTEKVDGLNEDAIHVIEYSALESANAENAKLKENLKIAIEALEFECGNRCAIGINPCNAREALEKIKELK